MTELDYAKYKLLLADRLDDYRYRHSICVADEADRLALKYNADRKKAYLAGLLHDVTKNNSPEEHLQIFHSFDIILSDVEKSSEKLWHAISGSVYIKEQLCINDLDIISSVRYHTTAKRDMSLLEKIIYVADFTAADRNYPDVEVMRQLADISLEDAIEYALCYTINELLERKAPVHPDTLDAYNYLIINKNSKGEDQV